MDEKQFGEEITTSSIIGKIESVVNTGDGFKVFMEIANNSDTPITSISMKFLLKDSKFEKEVNALGYGQHVDHDGWIYKGEKIKGFYQWNFKRSIDIKKVILNARVDSGESVELGVFIA